MRICRSCILSFGFTQSLISLYIFIINITAQVIETLSVDDLHQLQPMEIIQLRDFIRGRGKGTVSRVPLGNEENLNHAIAEEPKNVSSTNDSDVIDFGQQVWQMVPQQSSNNSPSSPMSFSFLPIPNKNNPKEVKNGTVKTSTNDENKSRKEFPNVISTKSSTIFSTSTISPISLKKAEDKKSTKGQNEPTEEEYERLAEILQTFVKRRKTKVDKPKVESAITFTQKPKPDNKSEISRDIIWPGLVEKTQTKAGKIELSAGTISPSEDDVKQTTTITIPLSNGGDSQEDYNEEMEQSGEMSKKLDDISNELKTMLHQEYSSSSTTPTSVLYFPEHLRNAPKAYVTTLREGIARQTNTGQYIFVASITLIRDSGKVILVDTGLSTDINGRTDMIHTVDYVVTTHGHADHAGNTNEFPDAVHFQGAISHHRNKFNFTDIFENERHELTPNAYLIKTPGHTSDDITVIVHNTDKYGTVAVCGDVFISGEDLDYPLMWKPLAWNVQRQELSRHALICTVDYIVPGHGKVFKVTSEMRNRFACNQSGK